MICIRRANRASEARNQGVVISLNWVIRAGHRYGRFARGGECEVTDHRQPAADRSLPVAKFQTAYCTLIKQILTRKRLCR